MDNTFYQQLLEQETALEGEISALEDKLRILKEFKKSFFVQEKSKPIFIPNETANRADLKPSIIVYSKKLTIPQKIMVALSQLKQANVTQVATKLVELDDTYTLAKAKTHVKFHLSRLGRSGEITVVTRGSGKRSGVYAYKAKEAA
ncbi:MAG: hypothetical protein JWQ66_2938 [Mucilaginibacter sp.]|nr:hypothetical protein [Mucilaginibacter sp.]